MAVNKIKLITEQSKTTYTPNTGLILTDDTWAGDAKRTTGEVPGTGASSIRLNTSLRQLSYVSYIVAEALAQKGTNITTDVGSGQTLQGNANTIASVLKQYLIGNAEVTTAKLADAAVTTAKIQNSGVTTDKIKDGNVTNNKIAPYTITANRLNNIVADGQGSANGIQIYLQHNDSEGADENGLEIGIESSEVTNAKNLSNAAGKINSSVTLTSAVSQSDDSLKIATTSWVKDWTSFKSGSITNVNSTYIDSANSWVGGQVDTVFGVITTKQLAISANIGVTGVATISGLSLPATTISGQRGVRLSHALGPMYASGLLQYALTPSGVLQISLSRDTSEAVYVPSQTIVFVYNNKTNKFAI